MEHGPHSADAGVHDKLMTPVSTLIASIMLSSTILRLSKLSKTSTQKITPKDVIGYTAYTGGLALT